MRACPVCQARSRRKIWKMDYKVPDGWPVPTAITWYECSFCGMLYGDGEFDQSMLDAYYRDYYGYGVDSLDNIQRLGMLALEISGRFPMDSVIVDFGGGDGHIERELKAIGFTNVHTIHVGDPIPDDVDVLVASHVLEHIYDLPQTMEKIRDAIKTGGTLIIDGPDSTGILLGWNQPIMDFNTKHINHFSLINHLDLGRMYNFAEYKADHYHLNGAKSWRIYFQKEFSVGNASHEKVTAKMDEYYRKLEEWRGKPVNIWGMGDITWHVLNNIDLDVRCYIDNDPAYRGKTYNGKPVVEMPDNDYPILILAQGQRERLVFNILNKGLPNRIVEI